MEGLCHLQVVHTNHLDQNCASIFIFNQHHSPSRTLFVSYVHWVCTSILGNSNNTQGTRDDPGDCNRKLSFTNRRPQFFRFIFIFHVPSTRCFTMNDTKVILYCSGFISLRKLWDIKSLTMGHFYIYLKM